MPDSAEWISVAVVVVLSIGYVLARARSARSVQHRRAPRSSTATTQPVTSPGQDGPYATREVPRVELDPSRMAYSPKPGRDPDPGEVVWTWVPFEENDGRGKDRPFVILESEDGGTFLGVYLTSKPRTGSRGYVSVGAGSWDSKGRPSWANVSRVFRVQAQGIRRGGDAMRRDAFDDVVSALTSG